MTKILKIVKNNYEGRERERAIIKIWQINDVSNQIRNKRCGKISQQKQQKSSEEIKFNYKTNLNRFL